MKYRLRKVGSHIDTDNVLGIQKTEVPRNIDSLDS